MNQTKEKRKRKKAKITFNSKIIQNKIKKIFDSSQSDLSYITNNKKLLNKHIKFINASPYRPAHSSNGGLYTSKLTIRHPRLFVGFNKCYEPIYRRWVRLLSYCYVERNECYPFFGKRGIKLCDEFLDSKRFCIWCLTNGLVCAPDSYIKYLVRKDKSGDYSPDNVAIISEKQLHSTPDIVDAIDLIVLAKNYEDHHHETVSYMSAYTRYYMHDFTIEDAISVPYRPFKHRYNESELQREISVGFAPTSFYKSLSDETTCRFNDFWSRLHMMYLSKIQLRPYDALKPDFSMSEYMRSIGKKSYKQLWEEDRAEKKKREQSTNNSKYSKLEQDLLNNPDLKNMKIDQSSSIIEDFIREL